MRSTGMEALDSRLGGIEEDAIFLVLGSDGVGKSVLSLHFLLAGLEHRERCLLVTPADPEEIDGRGMFIGFSPGDLSDHANLTIVDVAAAIRDSGGISGRHAPVEVLRQVMRNGTGGVPYSRVVIDDLNAFLQTTHTPAATARATVDLLRDSGVASYVTVSTADLVALHDEVLDTVSEGAAAIFELERTGRGRRRFTFHEVRQRSFSTAPFLYTLRSGGGFSEDLPAYERQVDHDLRRKIVVLDEANVVGSDVLKALSASFEVETYVDLDRSLVKLLEARYGVLVLGVDPYDPERAFNLTYTLRKAGNGAPILFVSPSRGLRSMTRSRGLRIGGDDFVLSELPPSEIVERIRVTAHRGHHRRNGSVRPDRQLQPRSEDGQPRPMGADELREALYELTDEAPTPFFALAVLDTGDSLSRADLWEAVRPHLRLNDGDLVSILPDGRLALVLNQVDSHLAERVLSRIRRTTPTLAEMTPSTLFTSPLQEEELLDWIGGLAKK